METQERLIVDVARLDKEGERIEGETSPELLEIGKDPWTTPQGGMKYDLFAQVIGQELLARGRAWQDLQCVCSRCGNDFATVAEEKEFLVSTPVDKKTEFVDLTEELRQAIILALPRYPLCNEECRGRCPKCGADLNEEPCRCKEQPDDAAFGAFGELLENGKKE